jgi:hypothetical protein
MAYDTMNFGDTILPNFRDMIFTYCMDIGSYRSAFLFYPSLVRYVTIL